MRARLRRHLVPLIAVAACSTQPMADDTTPRATGPAALDREFRIGFGQTVAVAGADLTVTFDEILDSRCPTGVTCVWEGTAHIELDVTSGGEEARVALDTHPDLGSTAEALGYDFTVVDVAPFPVFEDPQPREAYVATLIVTAAID